MGQSWMITDKVLAFACLVCFTQGISQAAEQVFPTKADLGRALFFDNRLSLNRTQSCATCHDPDHGFIDRRDNGVGGAVSLGDDSKSLGDRNTPSAAYARFSPIFHRKETGEYVGGQFLDGREMDLQGQAGGPPLNPIEMNLPDKRTVATRLRENPDYVAAFQQHFGPGVTNDAERLYASMAASIAAFEMTDFFAPFDSKYDRYQRGEYKMTVQEDLGMALFFSKQFTNCNLCHQLKRSQTAEGETFSNYTYHNIGIPVNPAVRALNGLAKDHVDHGLLANPRAEDPAQDGKFKVSSLRNVAVTAPYMHNGVFKDLRTVVLFYNKYNSRSAKRRINPETGKAWAEPEVKANISMKELETGPALKDKEIDALVAFLKILTDKRYEHLLTVEQSLR